MDRLQRLGVIVGGTLRRRHLVFANINPEYAAVTATPNPAQEGLEPLVVEAHAVDQRVGLREAKHPGLRIPRLGQGRYRSQLQEPKAQSPQGFKGSGVLIEPGGEAHAIRKGKTQALHGIGHRRRGQAIQLKAACRSQEAQREVVTGFRSEAKKPGA